MVTACANQRARKPTSSASVHLCEDLFPEGARLGSADLRTGPESNKSVAALDVEIMSRSPGLQHEFSLRLSWQLQLLVASDACGHNKRSLELLWHSTGFGHTSASTLLQVLRPICLRLLKRCSVAERGRCKLELGR